MITVEEGRHIVKVSKRLKEEQHDWESIKSDTVKNECGILPMNRSESATWTKEYSQSAT